MERTEKLDQIGRDIARFMEISGIHANKATNAVCGDDMITGLIMTKVLSDVFSDSTYQFFCEKNPDFTRLEIGEAANVHIRETTRKLRAKLEQELMGNGS